MKTCSNPTVSINFILNEIGINSCTDEWYCLTCGWNAKIEIWNTRIGDRYLCHWCWKSGLLLDEDGPKFLNYERDQASQSLRKDKTKKS